MTAEHYAREVRRRGTVKAVAEALGLHQTSVSARMRGAVPVSREAAIAIESLPCKLLAPKRKREGRK